MGTELPIKLDSLNKSVLIIFSIIVIVLIGVNNNSLSSERSKDVNVEDNSESNSGTIQFLRKFPIC